jgi:hypothetical protein
VPENRVLRRLLGPKREEVQEAEENCTMRNIVIFRLLFTKYNQDDRIRKD